MILRAGGFDTNADQSQVTLIRRDGESEVEQRTVYDVGGMLDTGNFEEDPSLIPNDLILVGKKDGLERAVYVLGAVNAPGEYPLPDEAITLSQAILYAGGFARFARTNRVKLIRTDAAGESDTTIVDLDDVFERGDRSNDPELQGGDVIRVDERLINF